MHKKIFLYSSVAVVFAASLFFASCNKTQTIKPEQKSITEAVYASGFLLAKNEYKVYALSDGYIVSKLKSSGDDVAKGEAIYQIQNDASAAKLGASSLAYELARKNAEENSPVLLDLKNKLKSAEAKFRNDSLNFGRYKNMFEVQAVTKSQFDQIALTYEISSNDVKSAKENLQRTKDQLMMEVKNAQSGLAASGQDASNYTIKSMMDGVVYDMMKELGEAVRRNDLVAMIGEKGNKILQLSVDQSDIIRIKVGEEVIVKMDVTGNTVYKAHITKIYPNMNQNDQSFKVEAEFAEPQDFQFVHASVEANIIINAKEKALVVPKKVIQGNDEVEVKGVGMNKMVKIKRGLENLEFVEVVEGLSLTDEIVLPKEK